MTITSTLSLQNEPSLSSAMAVTVWLSASRIRVVRPPGGRGDRVVSDDVGLRVALVEDVDRLDVIGRRHRASTETVTDTTLPLSTSGRQIELHSALVQGCFADPMFPDCAAHRFPGSRSQA